MGNRVYVSDVQESVHYLRYRPTENQLVIFSDDTYQRLVEPTSVKTMACQLGLGRP